MPRRCWPHTRVPRRPRGGAAREEGPPDPPSAARCPRAPAPAPGDIGMARQNLLSGNDLDKLRLEKAVAAIRLGPRKRHGAGDRRSIDSRFHADGGVVQAAPAQKLLPACQARRSSATRRRGRPRCWKRWGAWAGNEIMGADGARIGAGQKGEGPIEGLSGEMEHQVANAAALIFRDHIEAGGPRRRRGGGAPQRRRAQASCEGPRVNLPSPHGAAAIALK